MKELSIEEKAKRYDEAIQGANSIREGKCKNVFVYKDYNQKLIEYLFPKLKESEDEKIRKVIIQYLKDGTQYIPYRGYNLDECIAWLEKKGEQKVIVPKFRVGDTIKYKEKQWTIIGIDTKNYCYDLTDDECVDFDTADYSFELVEKKDVDNKISVDKDLFENIRNTCACIDDAMSSESLNDLKDYLSQAEASAQAAFDMIEEQKLVEWSEEDERLAKTTISFLDEFKEKGYENAVECIDWVKYRMRQLN